MIIHPKLYKKTATGATQIWYIESEDNKYRTVSGQIDGKHITSEFTTCEGKNLGKKNETSADKQCLAEVAALYKKKLAQGNYNTEIEDIDEDNYFKPMLAKKFEDYLPTAQMFKNGDVFCQPKLDGCLSGDTMISTDKGSISIREIVEKKLSVQVVSYNELEKKQQMKSIVSVLKRENPNKQWFVIITETGEQIKLTGDHRVFLPELNCWRKVEDLKGDEKLLLESSV